MFKTVCPVEIETALPFITWQHKDSCRPPCGARKLLELSPGVDGVMDQRFAPQAGQVEGSARDEQT